jgi:hypothetical protein
MPHRTNIYLVLATLVVDIFLAALSSIRWIWCDLRGITRLPMSANNECFEILNFIFHTAPRQFWACPNALSVGRSMGSLIGFIFYREECFERGEVLDASSF